MFFSGTTPLLRKPSRSDKPKSLKMPPTNTLSPLINEFWIRDQATWIRCKWYLSWSDPRHQGIHSLHLTKWKALQVIINGCWLPWRGQVFPRLLLIIQRWLKKKIFWSADNEAGRNYLDCRQRLPWLITMSEMWLLNEVMEMNKVLSDYHFRVCMNSCQTMESAVHFIKENWRHDDWTSLCWDLPPYTRSQWSLGQSHFCFFLKKNE